MNRLFSRLSLGFMLSAVSLLALAAPAQAEVRPHNSRGTGQFVSATEFVGAGTATHLGQYDEFGTVELTPTADPAVFLVDASVIYTAANGDQLYADIIGELDVTTGAITATVTYVGGTGRFASASGTATLSAQLSPTGSIDAAVHGNINY